MASPTLTLLNYQPLTTADNNTGWFDLTTPDTDIKVEGSASESGVLRADGEQAYYDAGSAPVSAAGKTFRGWINTINIPYMGTMASDPYKLLAYDGSTTELKNLFGSDTYPGGWYYIVWDMDEFTTLTLANVRRWGVEAGHASNAKNVTNTWMDVMRYLDGYSMTGGTSGDKVTLASIAALDLTNAYGIVQFSNTVFFGAGTIQFGTGATTHYFEMDGQILVFLDLHVSAGLYQLAGVGSGTNILIKNSIIKAAGTTDATRVILDFDDTNLASFSMTDNVITRAAASYFKTGQTVTGNVFDNCGVIYAAGADLRESTVKNYAGTADSSALVWDVNANPNGKLDNSIFTKGSSSAHAITLGTNCPSTITLTGLSFSGYNASNGQTDSVLYISDKGTDTTWTINAVGCTGTISYKKARAGDTVNLVVNPVTLYVYVKDADDFSVINGARVLVRAADGTGPYPYQESVSLSRSGSTVTVSHTSHGMTTGDYVVIENANEGDYNGVWQITYSTDNEYTYNIGAKTPSSPATGSPVSTWAITGLTSSGYISDSRTLTADQPVVGWARYAAGPYKTSALSGTFDSTTGGTITVLMVND